MLVIIIILIILLKKYTRLAWKKCLVVSLYHVIIVTNIKHFSLSARVKFLSIFPIIIARTFMYKRIL